MVNKKIYDTIRWRIKKGIWFWFLKWWKEETLEIIRDNRYLSYERILWKPPHHGFSHIVWTCVGHLGFLLFPYYSFFPRLCAISLTEFGVYWYRAIFLRLLPVAHLCEFVLCGLPIVMRSSRCVYCIAMQIVTGEGTYANFILR